MRASRRSFLALAAAASLAAPLRPVAQQAQMKRVVFFNTVPESDPIMVPFVATMKAGLASQGWIEGRNVVVDVRYGVNTNALAAAAAPSLVTLKPDVIVTVGQLVPNEVLKLTRSLPIVFTLVTSDPIADGWGATLARPGGMLTGFTNTDPMQTGKLVELLTEIAPSVRRVAWLGNTDPVPNDLQTPTFLSAVRSYGLEPVVIRVGGPGEIGSSLAAFAMTPGGGLIVGIVTVALANHTAVTDAMLRNRIPTVFGHLLFEDLGIVNYYIDTFDVIRRAGEYAGLILNGTKPGDLPIQAPSKYLMKVNLKTAATLGIAVPVGVLVRADEVIQ